MALERAISIQMFAQTTGWVSYIADMVREDMVMKIAQEAGFNLVYSKDEDRGVVPYRVQVYGKVLVFKKGAPSSARETE